MALKYIYAGYSKCGTKTVAELFKKLGFRVHDFKESLLVTAPLWDRFLNDTSLSHDQRLSLLREIYSDFEVCTDTPGNLFWQELLEAFPEAKCIFYQRPEKQWLPSFQKQMEVNNQLGSFPTFVVEWLFYLFSRNKGWVMRNVQAGICPLVTGQMPTYCKNWRLETFKFNDSLLLNAYRRHNSNFMLNCPRDRRLVLEDLNSDATLSAILAFIGQSDGGKHKSPITKMPHQNKSCEYTKVLMNTTDGLIYRIMIGDILKNIFTAAAVVLPLVISMIKLFS